MKDVSNNRRVIEREYNPSTDRLSFRYISAFAVLGISCGVLLALYDQHEIALLVVGVGTTCLGALTSFFTQNIERQS